MTALRDFLLLRLEAPLMAFGGPMVDHLGPTGAFPGQAQIVGLLGNALGYAHRDVARLERLQDRLLMAALAVQPGERLRDFQIADLGRPHMSGRGWTTRGREEGRDGANSTSKTIRERWYLADACVLVALSLEPAEEAPTLAELAAALDEPARPLFIGRKSCLPTAPLRLGAIVAQTNAEEALRAGVALLPPAVHEPRMEVDARLLDAAPLQADTERVTDRRDWRNQMHTGARLVHRVALTLPAAGGQAS